LRGEVEFLVLQVLAEWVLIEHVHQELDCVEMKAQHVQDLKKEKEKDEEQKTKMMKLFDLDVVEVELEVEIELWVCQRDRECLWSFQSERAIEACGV
jgi:hypothetical protein